MKKILSILAPYLFMITYIIWGIYGLGLHVGTVIIINNVYGFIAAMVAFCLPFFAEVWLFGVSWGASHTIFNVYGVACIGFSILSVIFIGLSNFVVKEEGVSV